MKYTKKLTFTTLFADIKANILTIELRHYQPAMLCPAAS
jgi:hypothetical protein